MLVEDLAKFHFACSYADDRLVLDAGCGAGQGTHYLATHGARCVVGVDISVEATGFAQRSYGDEEALHGFAQMDVTRLGFPPGTFDLVTSIEVIEHIFEPEVYVEEIRRVLKDTGVLVLSTPNKLISSPTPGSMWPHHVHEFYPEELETFLSGFFSRVEMWGLSIPVYDRHPLRRIVHWLAPVFKPFLPLSLRTRFLPELRKVIKNDISIDDVSISKEQIEKKSPLVVVCRT
jgi:SAM-dependent methyltransferase